MEVDVVIAGEGSEQQRTLHLTGGILTIGRSPRCSIALESALISRQHAKIDLSAAGP